MGGVWNGLLATTGGAVVVGTGVEVYALRSKQPGSTLSAHIRPWAQENRFVFLAACGTLIAVGAWLPRHILGGS